MSYLALQEETEKTKESKEETTMDKKIGKDIKFHFHPKEYETGGHTIEKADAQGNKKRYLSGISSGLNVDAHGERMTEKCIKSFMNQANSGEILLFPDIHGIKESEDIGKLIKAEITPTGDWHTTYMLYDETDGIGPNKAEKIETIWKQLNGLPPYKQARQKGFSIEGIIPDTAIVTNAVGEMDRTVIDDIELDGVVLVPRPAYNDSIATAIYKALGETTPQRIESIQTALREKVESQEIEDQYYKEKWAYLDALEETVEKIMTKNNNNRRQELEVLFNEYKDLMVNLILRSEGMFQKEPQEVPIEQIVEDAGELNPRLETYKALYSELTKLERIMEAKKSAKNKTSK